MFTAMAPSGSEEPRGEALELALREEQGRLVRELLPRQGGREVKMLEDGFLLEFDRGLHAVRFGLALQEAVEQRNQLVPSEQRLELRIGAHLGPVVHRDGDVFGEGVNLAARIESLARPGTLYVSESVAREVEGHPLPRAVRLGRAGLKNIRLPVGVFRVEPRRQSSRPAFLSRFRSLITHLRPGG
ncbi:adenylate/guanylate cyclase domain-containing protein [Hyalangium versicolor]|uniref:adenylate/guanylate cyclase domain-containing protein n=1 Tax=Hyalangium versicolor TaxID=2861190 RepID=UPI001CCDA169|nr:adenylate/guanylate cyclase domain-containing protein [Hyalangium versicolor]